MSDQQDTNNSDVSLLCLLSFALLDMIFLLADLMGLIIDASIDDDVLACRDLIVLLLLEARISWCCCVVAIVPRM